MPKKLSPKKNESTDTKKNTENEPAFFGAIKTQNDILQN